MTRSWPWAIIFIVAVSGIGALIGMNFTPGPWFQALEKPWFQPPNTVFAPVWTILYIMIGYVGWRVFLEVGDPKLRSLWLIQMALNFAWTPVFFGLQWLSIALVIIVALWVVLISFLRRAEITDRTSMWLMIPYFLWITFATMLNAAIWYLNPGA